MTDALARKALVVGDDEAERRRVMAWCGERWQAEDGGQPLTALDALRCGKYGAVVYTAGTDSIDLRTWFMAVCLSGFRGVVVDTRPGGATDDGIGRACSPRELQEALSKAG